MKPGARATRQDNTFGSHGADFSTDRALVPELKAADLGLKAREVSALACRNLAPTFAETHRRPDDRGMTRINWLGGRVSKWLWDVRRFGLTPSLLATRASPSGGPKILTISLPKAGTHLLESTLCRVPQIYRKVLPTVHDANIERWGDLGGVLRTLRPGQVAVSHLAYSSERAAMILEEQATALFLVRDPRDIVVSQAHYITQRRDHPQHDLFRSAENLEARVLLAIRGNAKTGLDSVGSRLKAYAGWLKETRVLTLRYEDLIGPQGGGSRDKQEAAIASTLKHLRVELSVDAKAKLAASTFAVSSPTFRQGSVGRWREVFTARVEDAFRSEADEQLATYGYDWEQLPTADRQSP